MSISIGGYDLIKVIDTLLKVLAHKGILTESEARLIAKAGETKSK